MTNPYRTGRRKNACKASLDTIRLRHRQVKSMATVFADRLRTTREKKGLSQTDLAGKAGLQPSAVSHFETGRRAPSFDNLRRLADALDVSIDYLMGRAEEPESAGPRAQKLFR